MASLVPDPIEKCAVCAASPNKTTRSERHERFRTVTKLIHLELLANTDRPCNADANVSRQNWTPASSETPGAREPAGTESNPARRQTSSPISTMNVDIESL